MNAKKDDNFVSSVLVALNTDGRTIVLGAVNPNTNALMVSDGTTGSDHGPKNALRDENDIPVLMGVSSSDFKTPVVVYGNSSNQILIKST